MARIVYAFCFTFIHFERWQTEEVVSSGEEKSLGGTSSEGLKDWRKKDIQY